MRARLQKSWLPVVAVAALSGCGVGEAEEAPIATAAVTRMDLNIVAEAAGTLEPIRAVDVMSKASGEVVEVLVEVGDQVEAGTLLAQVDPRDVQNEFNQIEADYEVTRLRYANAETQLERSQELLDAGVITEQEHETRNLDFASQQAAFIRAQQSLYLAQIRLEDVTVRAPLTGTVLSKTVEEGQVISSPSGNVSGGTVLFTIAELETLQVRSLVNEADVGRILPGMAATVRVDAYPDRTFNGQVEMIEPQASVSQSVVNYPVIVQLNNDDGSLKPGMSANITIRLQDRPNVLTVPNHSIVSFTEMPTAATFLGLPESVLLTDQSVYQELRREMATGGAARGGGAAGANGGAQVAQGEGAPAAPGAGGEGAAAPAPGGNAGAAPQGGDAAAAAPGQGRAGGAAGAAPGGAPAAGGRGNMSPEQIEQMMQQFGGRQGGGGGGGRAGGGGRNGGAGGGGGSTGGTPSIVQTTEPRNAVVFVKDATGAVTPRAVLVGVTDWTNSEIMAGLEEGEEVILLGGIQAQQSQQGFGNQMMRMGGGSFRF